LLADVNITLEVLLVTGLTVGMTLARRGHIEAHRTNQTTWVTVNAVLVAHGRIDTGVQARALPRLSP